MRSAVIYISVHHGNTRKVAEALAEELAADLFDLSRTKEIDLSGYDLIGLASGVFYHGLHERMREFISRSGFKPGQKVFVAATCGVPYRDYTKAARKVLKDKGAHCVGSFQCRGFDTFGPFARIGGIAKGHPDDRDIMKARDFARKIKKEVLE